MDISYILSIRQESNNNEPLLGHARARMRDEEA
jgi:hypothetical protein